MSLLDIPQEPTSGLQSLAIVIVFAFPTLALATVVLRNVGKLATRQFGLDDWLLSTAMLFSLAETVLSYFFIKTNFVGIRGAEIPRVDPTDGLIWGYAVQILYNPILGLVKASVLVFLLRLFAQQDGVRRVIHALNAVNVAQMLGVFFATVLQCRPVAFNWDPTIRGGECIDRRALYTANAALNILTDLLILGLPLWIFSNLNIPIRKKLGLMVVFLLGFFVTIASVVRLVILVRGLFDLAPNPDPTRNIGFVTSAIETNLAIITACAPALRPVLRRRDRGGWLPPWGWTKARDLEMGTAATAAVATASAVPFSVASSAATAGGRGGHGKYGRGGSRGGRRGGRRGAGKRAAALKKEIRHGASFDAKRTPLRSYSPRSSEELTMTANGIVRISDIQREIEAIDLEVGPGSYGGGPTRGRNLTPAAPRTPPRTPPQIPTSVSRVAPPPKTPTTPRTPQPPKTPRTPRTPTPSRPRTPTSVTPRSRITSQPPQLTLSLGTPGVRRPEERVYSASVYSVYPDVGIIDAYLDREEALARASLATVAARRSEDRDYHTERQSRYGDRRFGVVTPKQAPPRWGESGNRPGGVF